MLTTEEEAKSKWCPETRGFDRWTNEPRGSDGAQPIGYCGKAGRP